MRKCHYAAMLNHLFMMERGDRMIAILSPAKTMTEIRGTDDLTLPLYWEESKALLQGLKGLTELALGELLKVNPQLARLNYKRFQELNFDKQGTAALASYQGLQYAQVDCASFEQKQWDYANKHLRILSGFYGILRPLDSICPYRLEMQSKLSPLAVESLYAFWGDKLYQALYQETEVVFNLASKEYSKAITKHLTPRVKFLDCTFYTEKKNGLKNEATQAKIARGQMVRFMVENQVERPEELQGFHANGYEFSKKMSDQSSYVFIKLAGK